jgi:hypothetical protein
MTETNDILDTVTVSNQNQTFQKEKLPNSGGILTLGILSIVLAGGVGIILGIIALSLTSGAMSAYRANPDRYTEGSLKNVNGGKVCAIIGVSIAGFLLLILGAALIANS